MRTPEVHISGMRLLKGVCAGLLAFAVAAAGVFCTLPRYDALDSTRLYDYVYSGVKSGSTQFTLGSMSEDGHLAFGSSEFYISLNRVATCPQKVFGEHVTGVDLTYVGEAYDQSLWQAIAAGAYASGVKNKQVLIMVSPQWFFKNNGAQWAFSNKFNYSLYAQFCSNPAISQDVKDYVRSRAGALGVSQTQLAAANQDTPLDALNNFAYVETGRLATRAKLPGLVSIAPKKSTVRAAGQPTGEPDWDALITQATADGMRACTNNSFGVYDDYWTRNSHYRTEAEQNFTQAEDEFADFDCLLRVCEESGLEPLVCMIPMHGAWYDTMNVTSATRSVFYDRIRSLCDSHGCAYADFSSCEYEKYFLCDTVHPGWIGWVRIEEAFYDFVQGKDDPYLGGGSFGAAEGKPL